MIEAGQANAAHHHAGMCVGAGGQGIYMPMAVPPAKAVSAAINPFLIKPHPTPNALAGISEGTIEGAKNSIAVTNMVLTILRRFMVAPKG